MINTATKNLIRRSLKPLGLSITKYNRSVPGYVRIINHLGISTVLDVGANQGQFGRDLRDFGYRGKIVSFEPTTTVYEKLSKNASSDNNWVIHPRAAVGEKIGKTKINVAGNSALSSSILDMGDTHKDSAPESIYIREEEVDLVTIDSIFDDYVANPNDVCLKLDVQGYEDQALTGATSSLEKVRAVKLELSIVSLYETDKLYPHYFDKLKNLGFSLWDLEAGHRHLKTGRLYQFDAMFVRE